MYSVVREAPPCGPEIHSAQAFAACASEINLPFILLSFPFNSFD
jgi:hypothetical protein